MSDIKPGISVETQPHTASDPKYRSCALYATVNGRHAPVIGVIARSAFLEHPPGIVHLGDLVHVEQPPADCPATIDVVGLVRAKHLVAGPAHTAAVWLYSAHNGTIAECDNSSLPDGLGDRINSRLRSRWREQRCSRVLQLLSNTRLPGTSEREVRVPFFLQSSLLHSTPQFYSSPPPYILNIHINNLRCQPVLMLPPG
jgi:hypothetical protein